ncbi:MAG: hypothetical protein GYA62_15150 [Bacteroidales bacterium]|nr:hypothetical protein [Bacteroidales bacterium]
MISVQPTFDLRYFKLEKNKTNKNIKRLFYLSWEDAFWDILLHKNVSKNSNILLPNFYCNDVTDNIIRHGYNVVYYNIYPDLQVNKNSFIAAYKKHKPSVVVVFHPDGIKSNLFRNSTWLSNLVKESIFIEDSVHIILNEKKIKIIKRNHFIIDSLRKVVPLQGARVYGSCNDIDFTEPNIFQSFFYRFKVTCLWFLMVLCWTFGMGKIAEKLMFVGYELIGDAVRPSRGGLINNLLSNHINVEKIQKVKLNQSRYYEEKLEKIYRYKIELNNNDRKNLRGFPFIVATKDSKKILKYLRENGLMLRFELDKSEWSKKQKIIYLPMGFHIGNDLQNRICFLMKEAFERV